MCTACTQQLTFQNLSFLLLFSADHLAASPMASSIAKTIRNLGFPSMRLLRPGQSLQRLPNIGTDANLSQRFTSETNKAPLAKAACSVSVLYCLLFGFMEDRQFRSARSSMNGAQHGGPLFHS